MVTKKPTPAKQDIKKLVVKKLPALKKTATKRPARSLTPVKAAFTKSQILTEISRVSLLSKKEVISVLDELTYLISRHLKKGAIGLFNMPRLFKIVTVHKSAVKARKGVNPFNGEETTFKAKPARTAVKVRALKGLKDMT